MISKSYLGFPTADSEQALLVQKGRAGREKGGRAGWAFSAGREGG